VSYFSYFLANYCIFVLGGMKSFHLCNVYCHFHLDEFDWFTWKELNSLDLCYMKKMFMFFFLHVNTKT